MGVRFTASDYNGIMHTDSSNAALAQQQLTHMLDDLSADDAARLRTPEDILTLSYHLRNLCERGSPFERVPAAELPELIELMLGKAKGQLPESVCQAVALRCVQDLNHIGGGAMVPTILARNHGQCMAAIDWQVDLRSPDFWVLGSKTFWSSGGREAVMDDIQAAGQTWVECPQLFRLAHYWRLERSMQTLGKINLDELPGVSMYQDQQSWTRQLVQASPDIGGFLAGYMTYMEPDAKRLGNLVVALGVLERLGGPMPVPAAEVAQRWALALETDPPPPQPWPNVQGPLAEMGSALLRRLTLKQLAQDAPDETRNRPNSLRM